jgi:hypothetical protein
MNALIRLPRLAIALAMIVAVIALTPRPAFSGPTSKLTTLTVTNTTPAFAEIVLRTRDGLNEPKIRMAGNTTSSVDFEGTFQLGGIVRWGSKDVDIQPREITLSRNKTHVLLLVRSAQGEFSFK